VTAQPDRFTADQRKALSTMADVMLPETLMMPSASMVDVHGGGVDHVMMARPDLFADLQRAIDALDPLQFDLEALGALLVADEAAYTALTTAVAAAYYQSPTVRERIGYPGQVAKTYDPYAYVDWVNEGLLDPVVERGPLWRRPPGSPDQEVTP